MSDTLYSIVFEGDIVQGLEIDVVKTNLGKLFKTDVTTIEKMFEKERVFIKRKLDFKKAENYKKAVLKAGAIVKMVEESAPERVSVDRIGTAEESALRNVPTAINATLAAAGSILIESKEFVPANFDTTELSLAEVGGRLIDEIEFEIPEYDTSGMTLSPVGERILETTEVPPAQFNTDKLNLEQK